MKREAHGEAIWVYGVFRIAGSGPWCEKVPEYCVITHAYKRSICLCLEPCQCVLTPRERFSASMFLPNFLPFPFPKNQYNINTNALKKSRPWELKRRYLDSKLADVARPDLGQLDQVMTWRYAWRDLWGPAGVYYIAVPNQRTSRMGRQGWSAYIWVASRKTEIIIN